MMPNANNLALTLVSDKGKTQTKGNKSTSEKNSDFLKLFGKEKKEEKKKIQDEGVGAAMLPFKFTDNSLNVKPVEKNVKTIESAGNQKTKAKTETFAMNEIVKPELLAKEKTGKINFSMENNLSSIGKDSKLEKSLEVKTFGEKKIENNTSVGVTEVLGKRIESTKSKNPKLETVSDAKPVVENKLPEAKVSTNVQNLKKESLKVEDLGTAKLQNSLEVKESPIQDVQNKGRISTVFTKGNPLNGIEIQAKTSENFVQSETKRLEPIQTMMSSYGLKKLNDQIKLEEKVEGVKELKSVQKDVLTEKLGEKTVVLPMTQDLKTINLEKVEFINTNKAPQNVDYNTVMQQVENGLKINYNNQLKEMKIKLQPEELGEVEVKMTIENNIMKAQFVVESQTVKEILEAKFDTLRNALTDKGFSGAEINVSVSTGEKKSQNSFDFDSEKRDRKNTIVAKDYSSKVENLENNSRINKVSQKEGIDIMV